MARNTSICITFLFVGAGMVANAQQNNFASQAVTFGVLRSTASIEKAISSMDLSHGSGSTQGVTRTLAVLESIPAKITASLSAIPGKEWRSAPAVSPSTSSHVIHSLLPVPTENAQVQTDLQILLAKQRSLRVDNTLLVVTITD